MTQEGKDYRKFSNRVVNGREAGFIGLGFGIAVALLAAILLGVYFGTKCKDGDVACRDGKCIPAKELCDGTAQCTIGDDEWSCHAKEFYVAFRADNATYRPELSEDLEATNETKRQYEADILQALRKDLGPLLNDTNAVRVLRFRSIDEKGVDQNMSTNGLLAVDTVVLMKPMGELKERQPLNFAATQRPIAASNASTVYVVPEDIEAALRGEELGTSNQTIVFNSRGPSVTTGVGVVLRGPLNTNCRTEAVYCPIYCENSYKYGSTKGCPEDPCACVEEKK
ncbi:hypothetical protein RvY_04940 [Ramazzottius varieornatus]|uniref:SEA domain-containing protein n=1 Tax=Ramazzottius varieornatus TaxID=947166 RepID=A0A1D1UTB5_RAMVA|nr:hypothetical protein RvY_04940 [Ramazzottius varieornatus]